MLQTPAIDFILMTPPPPLPAAESAMASEPEALNPPAVAWSAFLYTIFSHLPLESPQTKKHHSRLSPDFPPYP